MPAVIVGDVAIAAGERRSIRAVAGGEGGEASLEGGDAHLGQAVSVGGSREEEPDDAGIGDEGIESLAQAPALEQRLVGCVGAAGVGAVLAGGVGACGLSERLERQRQSCVPVRRRRSKYRACVGRNGEGPKRALRCERAGVR